MTDSIASVVPDDAAHPTGLLHTLLTMSLTGVVLARPRYAADGADIVDFEWVRLNPAAQQMLRLPECPTASFLTLFPAAKQTEAFAFYRHAFLSGHAERRQTTYQYDGLDGYYLLVAQRYEGLLVVNFTDTNDYPRSAVEEAQRVSQAREQAARVEVERQRNELQRNVEQAQAAADHQRARLARLIEEAPTAICMLDGPDLVFELVNPVYQQLFPGRALCGKPVLEALPELAGGPVEAMLRGVYETGVTFEGNEMAMQFARPSDGQLEERFFNFIYQARYNAANTIDGLVVFAFEVSSQVQSRQQTQRLNEALKTTNDQLTHTNADLDTFVYAASHDLKAPIANIEGLLSALRDYLPTEDQQPMVPRLVGMMEKAIARFQQTVGYLTDVSRLQHEQAAQPVEVLDIARILEDVRLELLPLLESTHAELRSAVEPCPGVRFSAQSLRSVLFNLLSNAVKYRAADRAPLVQVRAHCLAQQLVLEVQDNGLGLTDKQRSQLFTMFRRLHNHVEGSGVGLYLIMRTVENAGGTLTVQSQPGVGSTFTVTLPHA